ncbi:DUF5522 domain-containing protein [Alteromonas sp.]|uniref:DUF5522 domain-containing protein n=1 Tax=Alteromonas sp. TaxID=232 RepID=UPI000C517B20|nr:hypothetical protein [Alteromonas sp.]
MKDIEQLHQEACNRGDDTYVDPATGYHIMTARYLLSRGFCCNSGCRHCPYQKDHKIKKK